MPSRILAILSPAYNKAINESAGSNIKFRLIFILVDKKKKIGKYSNSLIIGKSNEGWIGNEKNDIYNAGRQQDAGRAHKNGLQLD